MYPEQRSHQGFETKTFVLMQLDNLIAHRILKIRSQGGEQQKHWAIKLKMSDRDNKYQEHSKGSGPL